MTAAYYNEHGPFAAQWLRNLIAAGHIMAGDVDERDIQEVQPEDVRGYVRCHWFAGIGGWDLALRLAIWPDDRPVWTGSCPCQPFSSAGAGLGGDDPRHLWPAWFRLIRECRPDVVFGEQVESAVAHGWLDLVCDDLEGEGYATGAVSLPACSVGAPHIRQRLWWLAQPEGAAGRSDIGAVRAGSIAGVRDAQGQDVGRAVIEARRPGDRGATSRLADTQCGTAERRRYDVGVQARSTEGAAPERQRLRNDAGASGDAGGLADAEMRRLRIDGGTPGQPGHVDERDEAGRVGDPDHPGREEQCRDEPGPRPPWSDCAWMPCRDGKARPTQSGLFPLAHGVPGRVGRLRAYGNAIVPPLAARKRKRERQRVQRVEVKAQQAAVKAGLRMRILGKAA